MRGTRRRRRPCRAARVARSARERRYDRRGFAVNLDTRSSSAALSTGSEVTGRRGRAARIVARRRRLPYGMSAYEEAGMATTVKNKTQKPLSVPLPRGKVLHLGPLK